MIPITLGAVTPRRMICSQSVPDQRNQRRVRHDNPGVRPAQRIAGFRVFHRLERRGRRMVESPDSCLGSVTRINLPKNGFDMDLNGGLRNVEVAANMLVRIALNDALEDFGFSE